MSTVDVKSPEVLELGILPMRSLVLFPGAVLPVEVGRKSSLRLMEDVVQKNPARLLLCTQKDPQTEEPGPEDLVDIAVEAEVLKLVRFGEGRLTALVRGIARRRFRVVHNDPYLIGRVMPVAESGQDGPQVAGLLQALRDSLGKLGQLMPEVGRNVVPQLTAVTDAGALSDLVAAHLELSLEDRLRLLGEPNVQARLQAVLQHLVRTNEVIQVKAKIDKQVQEDMSQKQREIVLRQQMKAIQEELGEGGDSDDIAPLLERVAQAGMPEDIEKVARKQIDRLRRADQRGPDYTVQRTYLEWLCDMPWSKRSEDRIHLEEARAVLEADHYGLQKVKRRMLEYLAVRKLAPTKKGPILCLVGPPGVGKTSLGRSVARALGREFVRVSLGGVRDEAEIRGHRRTYIGALPGRIVQAVKRAGTKNPVLLMDEIDKLGNDHRGDPSAALLEVLDPEQNNSFSDHYLEVPFDLSEVIFIATANNLDTIPGPLLDRMELIELPGYTLTEKQHIAARHLIPKQIGEHGLTEAQVELSNDAVGEVIDHYTREAGVRNLEREFASVIRGVAMKIASGESQRVSVAAEDVAGYLGPAKYIRDVAEQTEMPGVATGLAWTPVGGDILFIEATAMPGKGGMVVTGKLGDVMKESAQAALSWVRTRGAELGLQPDFFQGADLHLHVPQGAMPKDGPSAGVTIATALVSLVTGVKVRPDVALTGEISLRGKVLPVGGIKEKVLAAHRAGLRRVVMPERNAKDLIDVPEEVKREMEFLFAGKVDQVLEWALERPVLGASAAALSGKGAAPEQVPAPLPGLGLGSDLGLGIGGAPAGVEPAMV